MKEVVGYQLIAETEEDKLILGSIRHIEFWSGQEDKPQYAGIKCEPAPEGREYVIQIDYTSPKHKKVEEEIFRESIKNLHNQKLSYGRLEMQSVSCSGHNNRL